MSQSWQEQLRSYQQTLAASGDPAVKAGVLIRMGLLAQQQARFEQAAHYYRQAAAYAQGADKAVALVHQGLLALARFELRAAAEAFGQALNLDPQQMQALNNLAQVRIAQNQSAEAEALLRRVLEIDPDQAVALGNLGQLLLDAGQPAGAIAPLERALELRPTALNHSRLAAALHAQGQPELAIAQFERALAIEPDNLQIRANWLSCRLNLLPWQPERLYQDFRNLGDRLAAGIPALTQRSGDWENDGQRLRIGYLSADFRAHSAAQVYEQLFDAHDRSRFEIWAYASVLSPDAVSERLAGLVDQWVPVAELSDGQLAERIRADRIQILVDLSGHTAGQRLGVMARRPAPVQVTGLGHTFTTGLERIDYRLTDAVCTPADQAGLSPEKIVTLPSWLCWKPPAEPPLLPPPAELAALLAQGPRPVLASRNNLFKLNAQVLDCWAGILRRVPEAVLLISAPPLQEAGMKELYRKLFAERGIEAGRLCLLPGSPQPEYLALYRHLSLCLDPFPCGGGLTTLDALWMDTPVLALDQGLRGSVSFLRQIGADQLIAEDQNDYCEKAVALLAEPDPGKPRGLRRALLAAPVCRPVFVQALEQAYTEMWKDFEEGT